MKDGSEILFLTHREVLLLHDTIQGLLEKRIDKVPSDSMEVWRNLANYARWIRGDGI